MEFTFKIVVGGAGGVGKTTLLLRYLKNVFKTDTALTVGVGFHTKELERNGHKIALALWDLGGQDRFRFLQPSYCAGARAGIIFFDMARLGTLSQVKEWATMFRKHTSSSLPIFLGGTKLDTIDPELVDGINAIAKETVEKLGLIGYMTTSSKSGTNVEEIINNLADMLVSQATQSKTAPAVPSIAR
nr:Rab family GTPase [Candidatus Sigynarchaeota archaeon]